MSGKQGGARPGAGRKKGSKNKTTKVMETLAKKIEAGVTGDSPLEVMIETMNFLRAKAQEAAQKQGAIIVQEDDKPVVYSEIRLRMLAVEAAYKAAPFVHPKLAQVESNVNAKVSHYEDSLLALANSGEPDGNDT